MLVLVTYFLTADAISEVDEPVAQATYLLSTANDPAFSALHNFGLREVE
jgi:hypothetical protein